MRTRKSRSLVVLSAVVGSLLTEAGAANAVTREEFSRRECAICHITWLDASRAWQEGGLGSDWAPSRIKETLDVVAQDDMCYSCHDGFVQDSRLRVWEGKGHSVGKKPSKDVVVPAFMPMNREGTVYCGTCHTPHGVGEQSADLTMSFFLRVENVDSNLCTQCHVSERKDPGRKNHPVNVLGREPLTQEIYWLGGRLGSDPRKIICQSCHTPHGRTTLLKSVEDSSLCLICHKEKDNAGPFLQYGTPLHPVGVPSKTDLAAVREPDSVRWGRDGRIICLTCHGVHSGLNQSLTLTGNMSTYCQRCHPDQSRRVASGRHNLEQTAPNLKNVEGKTPPESGPCRTCHKAHGWAHAGAGEQDTPSMLCLACHGEGGAVPKASVGNLSHPVDVEWKTLAKVADLKPLEMGQKTWVVCSTCHDPHGRTTRIETSPPKEENASADRMLRDDKMRICRDCHLDRFAMKGTKHDLTKPEDRKRIEEHFGKMQEEQECLPCHRVHNAAAPGLWFVSLPEPHSAFDLEVSSRKCLTCHGQESFRRIREEMGHPIGRPMKTEYVPNPDDRIRLGQIALDQGGARDVVICSTCHLSHGIQNPDGSVTLFAGGGLPEGDLCTACHKEKAQIRGSPHDFRTRKGDQFRPDEGRSLAYGECAGCHTNHDAPIERGLIAFSVDPPQGKGNPEDMFCLHCHLDPRIRHGEDVKFYVHPSAQEVKQNLQQRKKRREGPPTEWLGEPQKTTKEGYEAIFRIRCITCHDNHRWTPLPRPDVSSAGRTELTSFLRGSEVAQTLCANCHGAEALYRYRFYHHDRAFKQKIPDR
jgi:predicted CXXCH cytochrome family protein